METQPQGGVHPEQRSLADEAHARTSDPDTSHAAAKSVSDLTEKQSAVHRILRIGGPMTDRDLIFFYQEYRRIEDNTLPQQSESGIRTRRKELEDGKLVRKHDKVRLDTGRFANRYEVKESK